MTKLNSMVNAAISLLLAGALPLLAENKPPAIDHSPVKIAVRGQNIVVRARITDEAGPVKEATLFVAVSRDAAPFRIAMHDTGSGIYAATISTDLLTGLDRVQYYIDAVDAEALTTETPWSTVELKSPEPGKTTAFEGAGPAPEPQQSRWVKPALIAGGVLAVGGVALALSSGGGGGGGDDNSPPGDTTNSAAGTYSGSHTTCFQPPNAASTCASGPVTFTIDANGGVSTDTLAPGQHLTGQLSGGNFLLTTPVQTAERTGEIQYVGTVIDTRIVGRVQGTATTAAGTGTYSGTFSAVKQ
jgi:hypothetical protein